MYLRFVVGNDSADGRWLTGVITAAQELLDQGRVDPYQLDIIEAAFDWFNKTVPCPPFRQNLRSGKWTQDAVAWFHPAATEAIQKMWDLVGVLREHGAPVRVLRTSQPGLIVYRDAFQVVAETPKRGGRDE